jgi:hypothetical protein
MMDIKRSLLFDTYNGYLKTLNKLESVFIAKISNIGTVIVKAETYHYWQTGDFAKKNIVFIRFTVMPHKERLAAYKLVLRDLDVRKVLGVDVYTYMGEEKKLIALYSRLFQSVRLHTSSKFRFLGFPMEILEPGSPYAEIRVAKNEANSELFEEEEAFVTSKIFSRVIICKIVHKIQEKFVVITVNKDLQTKLITLEFYFPQLKRRLNTFLFASNKSNVLKNKLVHNVEKLLMKRLDNWHSTFVDVSRIQDHNHSMQFLRNPNKKATQAVIDVNDYQGYIAKIFSLLEEENRQNSFSVLNRTDAFNLNNLSMNLDENNLGSAREINDISTISEANAQRFKSQLYWEILTKAISIHHRPRNKLILKVGNSKNILKEVIFTKDKMIGDQIFRFDVVIEKPKSNFLLKGFKPEMFQNMKGVYYYLKVTNFTEKYERNAKLTLLKALELLDMKLDREYMINIQVIKRIAYEISKKLFFGIKEHLTKKPKSASSRHRKLDKPLAFYIDRTKPIDSNLHTRICEVVKVPETDQYEMLHKAIFMKHPLVSIEIHISHEKQEVLFLMYAHEERKFYFNIKKVATILETIPFFNQFLALGDKKSLGERLLTTFKNMLIIKYIDSCSAQSKKELSSLGDLSPVKRSFIPSYASPKLHFFPSENMNTSTILEQEPAIARLMKPVRQARGKVITLSHV